MTDLRTAARQALETLEQLVIGTEYEEAVATEKIITALKAALEQPEQDNFPEEKLQAVAEYFGDKYHVWYGIGARDVEEVLRQSVRRGLVTLNFDTGEQLEQAEPVAWWIVSETTDEKFVSVRPNDWSDINWEKHPLYTHPPRREWRSLSEEEIRAALPHEPGDLDFVCARAVEAALRSKNHE
jgi:hypothetical protein